MLVVFNLPIKPTITKSSSVIFVNMKVKFGRDEENVGLVVC